MTSLISGGHAHEPNDQELSHGANNGKRGFASNRKMKEQSPLGQLLGITQRSIMFKYDDSKERNSRRKLIPVNPKTLGDHLLLKRIEANLSQPEVAQLTGVSVRTVRKWEYGIAALPRDIGRR
jgi:DNA-binding transcriptional regulator YiaG